MDTIYHNGYHKTFKERDVIDAADRLFEGSSIMSIRTFALGVGILYIGAGLLGFIPGITTPPPGNAPHLIIDGNYGYLLGLFPVNVLHNYIHLGIGVWGLLSSDSVRTARMFAISVAVIYGLLALMGVLPSQAQTLFGFVPLFGHNVWLHAVTASIVGYVGLFAPAEVKVIRRTNVSTDDVKVYEEHLQP